MYFLTPELRKMLKKPLGKLKTIKKEKKLLKGKKIISVGDITTLKLIENKIKPYIAVFDYKYKRKKLREKDIAILEKKFKNRKKVKNPAGTITEELIEEGKKLCKKGGALFVEGEDDLSTLVFMLHAPLNSIIIYGQPSKGAVFVECTKETRELAKRIIKKMEKL